MNLRLLVPFGAAATAIAVASCSSGLGNNLPADPTATPSAAPSANAPVGLDLGVTDQLGRFGQAVLMLGMFVGRLGILLLLSAIWEAMTWKQVHIHRQNRIGYPREDLYV